MLGACGRRWAWDTVCGQSATKGPITGPQTPQSVRERPFGNRIAQFLGDDDSDRHFESRANGDRDPGNDPVGLYLCRTRRDPASAQRDAEGPALPRAAGQLPEASAAP